MQLVLTTFSALLLYWVVCCLCCVLRSDAKNCTGTYYEYMKDKKNEDISEVRTYKIKPLVLKPGKSSDPLPPEKKKLTARHALQSARIAPRPRPMCLAGFLVSEYLMFRRKVLLQREKLAKVRKFDEHTYIIYKYICPRIIRAYYCRYTSILSVRVCSAICFWQTRCLSRGVPRSRGGWRDGGSV